MINFHDDYYKYAGIVTKCRDFYMGEEAVKAKTTTYLPNPGPYVNYNTYLQDARFYEVVGHTVNSYLGNLWRAEPEITFKGGEGWLEDVDGFGEQFASIAKRAAIELLISGVVGVLADATPEGDPIVSIYAREDIVDWEFGRYGGLVKVVLREPHPEDKYRSAYRTLSLIDGIYYQSLSNEISGETLSEIQPATPSGPLKWIPFCMLTQHGVNPRQLPRPPFAQIANLLEGHYVTAANLRHAERNVSFPQPWRKGFDRPTQEGEDALPIPYGAGVIWVSSEEWADCGIIAPPPVTPLTESLASCEQRMRELGASLPNNPKGGESVESVKMRQSAQSSLLFSIASALNEGLTKTLRFVADFMGISSQSEIAFTLGDNFFGSDNPGLDSIIKLWQEGGLDDESFTAALVKLGVVKPSMVKGLLKFLAEEGELADTPEVSAVFQPVGKKIQEGGEIDSPSSV